MQETPRSPLTTYLLATAGIIAGLGVTLLVLLRLRQRVPEAQPVPAVAPVELAVAAAAVDTALDEDLTSGAPAVTLADLLKWLPLACGIVLAADTIIYSWDMQFDLALVFCWVAGTIAWWVALSERDGKPFRWTPPAVRFHRNMLPLALIIVAGVLTLFYNLDGLPGEMIADHGEYLLDVVRVQDGARDIYFANNSGREPLRFYDSALLANFVGASFLALKLDSAIIALLTLPVLYLMAREIDGRWTAFFAAAFCVFCAWFLIMGRIGFRVSYAMLATALIVLALWRALKSGSRADWLFVGLVLGFGQYGYTSFRIAPLLVVAAAALAWWKIGLYPQTDEEHRRIWTARRRLIINVGAAFLLALMIFLPLLVYWYRQPDIFWYRANAMVANAGAGSVFTALDALVRSALMFFLPDIDPVPLNLIAHNAGVISPLMAVLLAAGLVYWLWRAYRKRDPLFLFVPLAFLIMLLPSALGVSRTFETPSARRAIGALPLVMLMVGSVVAAVVAALYKARHVPYKRHVALAVGGLFLGVHAVTDLRGYFVTFADSYHPSPQRYVAEEVRRFVNQGGTLDNVYVVYGTTGGWADPRLIALWLGEPAWSSNTVVEIDEDTCIELQSVKIATRHPLMFVLSTLDRDNLAGLETCFPVHDFQTVRTERGDQFNVVRVP